MNTDRWIETAKQTPLRVEIRRFVVFIVLMLALLAFVNVTFAANVVVTWTHPTTNTDTSAIPATGPGSIASTRVEYGTCSGTNTFGVKAGEVTVNAPATTATISNVLPSTVCVRAFSKNTFLVESAASNVASKVIPAPTPGAPTITTVDTTAYEIKLSGGVLVASRIGYVNAGTMCSAESMQVAGVSYNRVQVRDTDLINWPAAKVPTPWARCG